MGFEWNALKVGNAIDRDAVESRIVQLRAIKDDNRAKSMLRFFGQRKPGSPKRPLPGEDNKTTSKKFL